MCRSGFLCSSLDAAEEPICCDSDGNLNVCKSCEPQRTTVVQGCFRGGSSDKAQAECQGLTCTDQMAEMDDLTDCATTTPTTTTTAERPRCCNTRDGRERSDEAISCHFATYGIDDADRLIQDDERWRDMGGEGQMFEHDMLRTDPAQCPRITGFDDMLHRHGLERREPHESNPLQSIDNMNLSMDHLMTQTIANDNGVLELPNLYVHAALDLALWDNTSSTTATRKSPAGVLPVF